MDANYNININKPFTYSTLKATVNKKMAVLKAFTSKVMQEMAWRNEYIATIINHQYDEPVKSIYCQLVDGKTKEELCAMEGYQDDALTLLTNTKAYNSLLMESGSELLLRIETGASLTAADLHFCSSAINVRKMITSNSHLNLKPVHTCSKLKAIDDANFCEEININSQEIEPLPDLGLMELIKETAGDMKAMVAERQNLITVLLKMAEDELSWRLHLETEALGHELGTPTLSPFCSILDKMSKPQLQQMVGEYANHFLRLRVDIRSLQAMRSRGAMCLKRLYKGGESSLTDSDKAYCSENMAKYVYFATPDAFLNLTTVTECTLSKRENSMNLAAAHEPQPVVLLRKVLSGTWRPRAPAAPKAAKSSPCSPATPTAAPSKTRPAILRRPSMPGPRQPKQLKVKDGVQKHATPPDTPTPTQTQANHNNAMSQLSSSRATPSARPSKRPRSDVHEEECLSTKKPRHPGAKANMVDTASSNNPNSPRSGTSGKAANKAQDREC